MDAFQYRGIIRDCILFASIVLIAVVSDSTVYFLGRVDKTARHTRYGYYKLAAVHQVELINQKELDHPQPVHVYEHYCWVTA